MSLSRPLFAIVRHSVFIFLVLAAAFLIAPQETKMRDRPAFRPARPTHTLATGKSGASRSIASDTASSLVSDAVGVIVKLKTSNVSLGLLGSAARRGASVRSSGRALGIESAASRALGQTVRRSTLLLGDDFALHSLRPSESRGERITGAELETLLRSVEALDGVEYAIPDRIVGDDSRSEDGTVLSESTVATFKPVYCGNNFAPGPDPSLEKQWHLGAVEKSGFEYSINVAPVWAAGVTGSKDLLIGIVDTGIFKSHPDLAANIDARIGTNLVKSGTEPVDTYGHGTHVAGIIGAVAGNGFGGSGVVPNARMIMMKYGENVAGSESAAVAGIAAALDAGAKVINLSFGSAHASRAYDDVFSAGRKKGVIFVAGAGNDAANLDYTPSSPGGSPQENVLTVASIERDGKLSAFSNYGAANIQLAAPGGAIFSTWLNDSCIVLSGTSDAAPMVTGAIALLWSKYPNETYRQILARVVGCTRPLPASQRDFVASGGTLDVGAALAGGPCATLDPPPVTDLKFDATVLPVTTAALGWAYSTKVSKYRIVYSEGIIAPAEGCASTDGAIFVNETSIPQQRVANLNPSANYTFRVCPGNRFGFGAGSTIAWHPPTAPKGPVPPPVSVFSYLKPNQATTAKIGWSPADRTPILRYRLGMAVGIVPPTLGCSDLPTSTTALTASFTGLSASTAYSFKLCAEGVNGFSPPSTLTFTTAPAENYSLVFYVTPDSVRVTWVNPGKVGKYLVSMQAGPTPPPNCKDGRAVDGAFETTFTGLEVSKVFAVRVCSIDFQGDATVGVTGILVTPVTPLTPAISGQFSFVFQSYSGSTQENADFVVYRTNTDSELSATVEACNVTDASDCRSTPLILAKGISRTPWRLSKGTSQGAKRFSVKLKVGTRTLAALMTGF